MEKTASEIVCCSICKLPYGQTSDRVPRTLKCGHTYCHSCLESICCSDACQTTAIPDCCKRDCDLSAPASHDIQNLAESLKPHQETNSHEAVRVCSIHPVFARECNSSSRQEFGCLPCRGENMNALELRRTEEVAEKTRKHLNTRIEYCKMKMEELKDAKVNVAKPLQAVENYALDATKQIEGEISALKNHLQRRKKELLDEVQLVAQNRKEKLSAKKAAIDTAISKFNHHLVQAEELCKMDDAQLLEQHTKILATGEASSEAEDAVEMNGSCTYEAIPVYIGEEVTQVIRNVGIIGGGEIPTKFSYTADKGILVLQWEPFKSEPRELEVATHLVEENFTPNGGDTDTKYSKIDGKLSSMTPRKQIPGRKNRFRIRSCDKAGWGEWSEPVIAQIPCFPLEIGFTGEIVTIRITKAGWYRITARGAKAADGSTHNGGRGAIIAADFEFNDSCVLEILVGGMSKRKGPSSGGAGGTFVALEKRGDLLIVAGGGGGTRGSDQGDFNGLDASTEEHGLHGFGGESAEGGSLHSDAGKDANFTGPFWGCGGAGCFCNSETASSFQKGGRPLNPDESAGGFGGGGDAGFYGGGGGGGFCGGGGGRGGGGGGSFVCLDGKNIEKSVGNRTNGSVRIEKI